MNLTEFRAVLAAFIAALQQLVAGLPGADNTTPTVNLTANVSQINAPGSVEFNVTASTNTVSLEVYRYPGAVRVATLPPVGGTFSDRIESGSIVYQYRAVARAADKREAVQEISITVDIPPVEVQDATPPSLSLRVTPNPVTAAGTAMLIADVTDDVAVASVTFRLTGSGARTLGTVTEAPFIWEDDTPLTTANNGTRTYEAIATDTSGNVSAIATASVQVNIPIPPDVTAPVISSFTMPNHPSLTITEAGSFLFRAIATDNVALKYVLFYWNNIEAKRKTTAPYEINLDFTAANNGPVQIRARAYDTSDNFTDFVLELTVNISGAAPINPALYVEPDPATIPWGAPIVINDAYLTARGATLITTGEYAGRWKLTLDHPALNLVTGDCAVWVNTTKPLLLTQSTWCGVGGGGTGRGAIGNGVYGKPVGNSTAVDIVIEDCTQIKPTPAQMQNGQYAGGLRFAYPKNVIVRNSNINGPGLLVAELNPANGGTAKFQRNKVRNIDGRIVDKTQPDGWKTGLGTAGAKYVQAVQLDKVRNTPGIEISDNDIENLPGESRVEDNINTYKSGGTAASPLKIFRNLINGAYSGHPNDAFSGSAVVMGDEGGDRTEAIENTAVNTSNTAISMSSMNYGKILRNKMAQTGLLPDGSRVDANGTNIDVGVYARNYAGDSGFIMDKTTNVVDDNDIAWNAPLEGQPNRQLNYGFSDNASAGPIGNRVYGVATDALIQTLISNHRAAWQSAGVIVGRRKP
ncbi:Ig-like domain-containing protein [Deinococcus humi]|uniref:Right handed beta helix domain-containing protein n=1 Tax=Deinococcus humi TaxID=662880 RepID=A0A7W8JWM0_9DEIO|nr:Ig-like domain-containing protein [Deinococcus humi]MBB5363101.1 hypothetical protein [Deinococcus humi]GGO24687.1 hypothetical protein GCM10008949_13850 [Deinococcus humi]